MQHRIVCPLCFCDAVHEEVNGTHIYVCQECPFVGMEFINDKDAQNLFDRLTKKTEWRGRNFIKEIRAEQGSDSRVWRKLEVKHLN